MSILNVNQIQPVGSGQTITVSASDIAASSATVTASNFTGNVTGNINATGISTFNVITGVSTIGVTTIHVTGINDLTFPTAGSLGRRNLIINGSMLVDQRNGGASASPTGTYGFQLDRYAVWYSTGSGHTVQQVEDAPTSFQYSWKFTTGTGATPTGSDYGRLYYPVEGYDANVLELGTANQQAFTFSFYVKISVAGTYGVQFADSLTTTKYQTSFSIAANEVGTWVRRVITVPAGTIVNGTYSASNALSFVIAFDLGEGPTRSVAAGYQTGASSSAYGLTGGTKIMATSGATYQLTGIQLEIGSVATDFEHRSYGEELLLCQRYYYQTPSHYHFLHKNGYYESQLFYFPTTMRTDSVTVNVPTPVLRRVDGTSNISYTGLSITTYADGFYLSTSTTNNNLFYTFVMSGSITADAEF